MEGFSQQPLPRHTKNKASYIVFSKKTVNLSRLSVITLSFRLFVRSFFVISIKRVSISNAKKKRFSGTFYTEMNTVAVECAQNLRH